MYLDIKSTVWERIEFQSEEELGVILDALKSGEITQGWEVCEILERGTELLLETGEEMTVENNGGCATLEVYDSEHSQLWTNSKT